MTCICQITLQGSSVTISRPGEVKPGGALHLLLGGKPPGLILITARNLSTIADDLQNGRLSADLAAEFIRDHVRTLEGEAKVDRP